MGSCLVGVAHGGGVRDWCAPCAGNKLGAKGGKMVGEALQVNNTLLHLDLARTLGVGRRIRTWVGWLMHMGKHMNDEGKGAHVVSRGTGMIWGKAQAQRQCEG